MALIETKDICKSFPGVKALSNVSISVEKGEVHAIVGENGAGKSTLMKILGGLYERDSGKVLLSGKEVSIRSISDALHLGISVIYQELNLMPELTVAENIYISELPGKMGAVNYKKLNEQAQRLIDELGLSIRPADSVAQLSVSERQMVEILKALSHNAEIIIMDEPTAALNNQEVQTLYEIIRKLKESGKTILYISHRLREIFDLSDRISVLRDGQFVGTCETKDMTEASLVPMMVGRDISQLYKYATGEIGEELLRVDGFTRKGMFEDVTFSLHAGEVVGMAGLMGCGREDIARAVYGLMQHDSGTMTLLGEEVDIKTPTQAIARGLGYVTEDRKDSGIFALMTVQENITINILRRLTKWRLISEEKERELLDTYTKTMNMKYADETQRIMFLSGGNQQKFILARALASECRVLIMQEPTRGIDVGAKAEIYTLLSQLAQKGLAILVISSELPEIMSICHRTLVVFQGKVTGNIARDEMDEELIMRCATGSAEYFSEGVLL